MFSIAPLLVHDAGVPVGARSAIQEAMAAPASSGARDALLAQAARILYREGSVECADALELVGLDDSGCGC